MSGQYTLTKQEFELIINIIKKYPVDLIYGSENELDLYNEVSIKICDEDGLQGYIQVN